MSTTELVIALFGSALLAVFLIKATAAKDREEALAPVIAQSDEDLGVTCLRMKLNGECEIDTFDWDGRTCIRWFYGYGSDMECYPTGEAG